MTLPHYAILFLLKSRSHWVQQNLLLANWEQDYKILKACMGMMMMDDALKDVWKKDLPNQLVSYLLA